MFEICYRACTFRLRNKLHEQVREHITEKFGITYRRYRLDIGFVRHTTVGLLEVCSRRRPVSRIPLTTQGRNMPHLSPMLSRQL